MTEKVLLRYEDLEAQYGLARSVVKELVAKGDFPKPRVMHVHGRTRVWLADEVRAWAAQLNPAPMGAGTFCGDEY